MEEVEVPEENLVGRPGDEYTCTHEHVCGDECLSFKFSPERVDSIGRGAAEWSAPCLPPLPELMVIGELAQGAAEGRNDVGLDEAAVLFAARFARARADHRATGTRVVPDGRRKAIEAAVLKAASELSTSWYLPK